MDSTDLLDALNDFAANNDSNTKSMIREAESLYIRLLILRASLRPHLDTGSSGPQQILEQRCRMKSCLQQVLSYIKGLDTDDMAGFWPPWCQSVFTSVCFTLLAMAVSAPDIDDASEWVRLLWAIRKELRLKANYFPIIRLSLLRIDSIFWRGVDNVLNLESHVSDAFKLAQAT